jgi:hypothetical protein
VLSNGTPGSGGGPRKTDQSKDRYRASVRPHRQWCATFGQTYANGLRRRRARPGDTWHLDEVFITINGKTPTTCGGRSISTAPCWTSATAFLPPLRLTAAGDGWFRLT